VSGPTEADSGFEIQVEPLTEAYGPGDARWFAQVAAFYDELRAGGIAIRAESTPIPNAKGDAATIIAAMGSAGVFTAAVAIFKAWLARDRTRSLKVLWEEGGQSREILVTADTDNETLEHIALEAMKRQAGD
jgi:Effector Associated Constant Component 1